MNVTSSLEFNKRLRETCSGKLEICGGGAALTFPALPWALVIFAICYLDHYFLNIFLHGFTFYLSKHALKGNSVSLS